MRKIVFAMALLAVSATASAEKIGVAQRSDGVVYIITPYEHEVCGEFHVAIRITGGDKVPGCWKAENGVVRVVTLDGEVQDIPADKFTVADDGNIGA